MLTWFEHLLSGVNPWAVHALIAGVVLIESMGIPLPGETMLIAASILSAGKYISVTPLGIALWGAIGATIGDSLGYWIVREHGDKLLRWLHRRFPKHVSATELAWAQHIFGRYGFFAVFGGRFVALLRMFAGPISGLLRMHYYWFLLANALGAIVWSFTITYSVYFLGLVAESYLKSAAWIALLVFITAVVAITIALRHRMQQVLADFKKANPDAVAEAAARLS